MTDPLVERVARAIHACDPGRLWRSDAEEYARAAIAAIREAEPSRRYLAWICHGCDECAKPDSERTTPCHGPSMSGAWVTLAERPPWMSEEEYAEPLTSTPEPSTTETEREAPISQDPPPGFEWEYRAVEQMEDTMNGGWYDPNGWGWTSEHDAHADALLIEGACVKERVRVWLERRLVGKPERMGD